MNQSSIIEQLQANPSNEDAAEQNAASEIIVDAVYQRGVIKPLSNIELPPGTTIQMEVLCSVTAYVESYAGDEVTAHEILAVSAAPKNKTAKDPTQNNISAKANHEAREKHYRTKIEKPVLALLAAAILLGGALRLFGLNWDQGRGYHPDERWITMVTTSMHLPDGIADFFDPQRSPLNPYYDLAGNHPRNFAYGTLPVYLTKLTAWTLSQFLGDKWQNYDHIPLVGRALSSLLDIGAIWLVFLLGRRLWGDYVGILGSFFYAFTVLSIQHSHFFTTDITLNFFVLLAIFCGTEIVVRADARSGILTGAAIGMAIASKFSAMPILLIIPLSLVLRWFRLPVSEGQPRASAIALRQLILIGCLAIASCMALHFLFQPYFYLNFSGFLSSIAEQNRIIVTGEGEVPYTQQYIGTTPYLYFLGQIVRYALGSPLAITAFIGWGFLAFLAVKNRSAGSILLLAWMVPYFLIIGRFHAKFLRYVLPLLPFLDLAAALLLMRVHAHFLRLGLTSPWNYLSRALITLVVGATAFWALAFAHIYTVPHTANQASVWINQNVPSGSAILKEHWEEGIGGLKPGYRLPPAVPEIPMYEQDSARKLSEIQKLLVTGDYMVFYSNRLYGTIPRLPERYPMSRRYYELLMSGKLGFELVHFSEAYPRFAGVAFVEDTFSRPDLPIPAPLAAYKPAPLTINGGFADESFTAYDHPLVLVFKKTRPVTALEIDTALRPYLPPERR